MRASRASVSLLQNKVAAHNELYLIAKYLRPSTRMDGTRGYWLRTSGATAKPHTAPRDSCVCYSLCMARKLPTRQRQTEQRTHEPQMGTEFHLRAANHTTTSAPRDPFLEDSRADYHLRGDQVKPSWHLCGLQVGALGTSPDVCGYTMTRTGFRAQY
jgi:hypothetical protein